MLLRGKDDPNILNIMQQKTCKYTDHHIQDELMKVVACSHLSKIGDLIRNAGCFALEADEVTDSSNKEQLIIYLRWVDNHFDPHEEFICLCDVDDTTANTIVYYLKDTVLHLNLSISMCRAQCYDGASNLKKVAKEIQTIEPRALYLHCHGHSLNLAVSDTLKSIKCLSGALDHSLEICKLLKYSPRRDAIFHKLHQELSPQAPGIRNLCPTCWIVRALSLESIRVNYTTLEVTWNEALEVATQPEIKSRINGVASKMKEFDFLFGLMLAEHILKHTDNLSKIIQATALPAVEARGLSTLCIEVFKKIRTEDYFDQFWELAKSTQHLLNVKDPALPRTRKRPLRYEDGTGEAYHPSTPKDHYRQIYFQCLDCAIVTLDNCFNQQDFVLYSKLEELIIKAAINTDYTQKLQEVIKFYGEAFNASNLETQL